MLLLVAANAAPFPPPRQTHVQAIVSTRIEHPAIANRKEWDRTASSSRREIIVRGKRGEPVLVRIIEYQ